MVGVRMGLDPVSAYVFNAAGRRGPVVLMYHVIEKNGGRPEWPWAVSLAQFERHLDLLQDGGWRTATLREIAEGRTRDMVAGRTVVLSFDDGYENNLYAAEAMAARDMVGSWFVVSGAIGRDPHWADPGRPKGRLLNGGQLRDLAAAGHEIGSHSVNHKRLPHLSDLEMEFEIQTSKASLEDLLGHPVDSFAYPFGAWDRRSEKSVIRAGYRFACTTQTGAALIEGSSHRVRRLTVFNRDSVAMLARKLAFASHDAGWGAVARYLRRRAWERLREFRG